MNDIPRRRSRRESQENTRAQLKHAALQIISGGGVAAASIRGVCQRAGFTQGAFYSNFDGMDDLLLALVEDHTAALAGELHAIVAETQGMQLEAGLQRIAARMSGLARDPALSLMVVELHLHARRNADFAAAFEPVKRRYRSEFSRITTSLLDAYDLRPGIEADRLASVLMSLWSGAILQIDPHDDHGAEDHMLVVFRALTSARSGTDG